MSYSTSVNANLAPNPELEKLVRDRSDLKTGEKLEGKVFDFKGNGKAVIDFGNFKAEVSLDFPVEKGDVIKLVVQEQGKQLKLKIESHNGRQPAQQVQEGTVQQDQSVEELYSRINKLLDKDLKNLEISGSTRSSSQALEDVSKELSQLKEYLQTREAREPLTKEVRQQVEQILKHVEKAAEVLSKGSTGTDSAQQLESLAKAIRNLRTVTEGNRDSITLQERIVKDVARLNADIDQLEIPNKKEVQQAVQELSKIAEKIDQLDLPRQQAEMRRIVTEELNPQMNRLREIVSKESEAVPQGSKQHQQMESVKQRLEALQTTMLMDPVEKSTTLVDPIKELTMLTDPIKNITTNMEPLAKPNMPVELDIEVVRLRAAMEPVQRPDPVPTEVKPRLEQVTAKVELALKELPAAFKIESSLEMESLSREIRSLRTTLDMHRDFHDLKEQVVKEITRLSVLAEELDIPARKEVDAVIKKLTTAAENMQKLESPDQQAHLRRIVSEQVVPNLKELNHIVKEDLARLTIKPEVRQSAQEMLVRADSLQQDIQLELQKLFQPVAAEEIPAQIERVDISLTRLNEAVAQASSNTAPEVPHFSESIQTIYENIKTALNMLKHNLQISGDQLEIPEEVRQIFQNLQSDLKAAEATGGVLKQLTQLKEMIQQSGLPLEKFVDEVVESLDQLIRQVSRMNEKQDFQAIRQLVQKQLAPHLKMLGDVFGSNKLLTMLEGHEQVEAINIRSAVKELQNGIESAFIKQDAGNSSTELTRLTQLTEKLASMPQGGKGAEGFARAPESIAQLSQNIEELLSRLPENSYASETNSALPGKIKSLLSSLQTHFEPLDISRDAMKLVPKLKSLVDDSGIFFEKKIADVVSKLTDATSKIQDVRGLNQLPEIRSILENDMKPNLLQLKEMLGNEQLTAQLGDGKKVEAIQNAVEDLLSNIGTQQEQAIESRVSQEQPHVQVLSFHLPIKGQDSAELKVFYNKGRKKDSPDEYKLSLYLEMEKLGEVRSDFFHLKDNLSITFYVRDKDVKDLFRMNLPEVKEALEPVIENVSFNIVVSEPKTQQLQTTDTTEDTRIITDKEVDVKI